MAVNRVPVLKRCRSLGMEPMYLGYDKKSKRSLVRSNRKMSRMAEVEAVRTAKMEAEKAEEKK